MIKRTNKIVKQQVTIYIEDWQLDLIDKEAKDNEISRTLLISKVLEQQYNKHNTTTQGGKINNGTESNRGDVNNGIPSNGISRDEL